MNTRRVSILGLGLMGSAIAERLEGAGRELAVWNRSPAKSEPFAARGVRVLEAPEEAWDHAPVAITMLADGAALEAVAGELLGGDRPGRDRGDDERRGSARPGRVLVDMSTV